MNLKLSSRVGKIVLEAGIFKVDLHLKQSLPGRGQSELATLTLQLSKEQALSLIGDASMGLKDPEVTISFPEIS